jgi:hypothetical protein
LKHKETPWVAAVALGYGQVGHCPTKYLKKHKSFVVLLSLHYNFVEGFTTEIFSHEPPLVGSKD